MFGTPLMMDSLVEWILRHGRPVRVLVDGRSGSGKTTFAAELARRLDAELIHLDSIYPGWSGLEEASRHVHDELLTGNPARWRRWDWEADAPAEWHMPNPERAWVIEGCGALSWDNRLQASFAIWLDAPDEVRHRRALERDGELFAAHWQMWADQEREFIDREHPQELADLVLDTRHDPSLVSARRGASTE